MAYVQSGPRPSPGQPRQMYATTPYSVPSQNPASYSTSVPLQPPQSAVHPAPAGQYPGYNMPPQQQSYVPPQSMYMPNSAPQAYACGQPHGQFNVASYGQMDPISATAQYPFGEPVPASSRDAHTRFSDEVARPRRSRSLASKASRRSLKSASSRHHRSSHDSRRHSMSSKRPSFSSDEDSGLESTPPPGHHHRSRSTRRHRRQDQRPTMGGSLSTFMGSLKTVITGKDP